ncbi:MAG: exonuclease domain-containing protein [Bacteroidales bacterium]
MEIEQIIRNLRELNFTAIDFETANERRDSACSLGIVRVDNGLIAEQKQYLIRPKELRFREVNSKKHKLNEIDITNAPEFDTIWSDILPYFEDSLIVAHSACFDVDVLRQTLTAYSIKMPNIKSLCTHKLAQETLTDLRNYRLNDVAKYLELNLNHHDSLSDANVAAEIAIKGIPIYGVDRFTYSEEELTSHIKPKKSETKKDKSFFGSEKKLTGAILIQNLDAVENKDNPFYNKKVVFTGDMESIKRNIAAEKIQAMGADINTSISRKTDIVVVGSKNVGPSKMQKIADFNEQGAGIRLIYEEEFLRLIDDNLSTQDEAKDTKTAYPNF